MIKPNKFFVFFSSLMGLSQYTFASQANPSGVVPNIIIGQEDRIRVNNSSYPWTTFGKLKSGLDENNMYYACSATLVGPRHVITSAHCIDVDYPYYFYPSYNNGDYVDLPKQVEAQVITIYSASGEYDLSEGHKPLKALEFSMETDWALLVLDADVGNDFGWQEPLAWDQKWLKNPGIYNVSYAYAPNINPYGDYPLVNKSCQVRIDEDNYLWHDCDTNGGASGSSLTTMIGDKSYVVGVHNTGWGSDYCSSFESYTCANGAVKADIFMDTWNKIVKPEIDNSSRH